MSKNINTPQEKTLALRREIIRQTLIRLQANRQGDNGTMLHAEIERKIIVNVLRDTRKKNSR